MIRLQSSDGEVFEVDHDVIKMSSTISTMLQGPEVDIGYAGELETQETISVSKVSGAILRKVLEWCEHHKTDTSISQPAKGVSNTADDSWDATFTNVDKEVLFELILGKTPQEIGQILTIEDDFTPEEEEQTFRMKVEATGTGTGAKR